MSIDAYLAAVEANEMAALHAQWGAFPLREQHLVVDHPFLTGENQKLVSDHRRAEICYIMHRGNVGEGILLHIKTFYPPGGYRLPTGGIHQGQQVMETLAREVEEETGIGVGSKANQVQVQHCMGVLSYTLEHRTLGKSFTYATYHFLVQMPPDGVLSPLDPEEHIAGWQWRRPDELAEVAESLEQVGTRYPTWADWGRYRALSHRFVVSQLVGKQAGRFAES